MLHNLAKSKVKMLFVSILISSIFPYILFSCIKQKEEKNLPSSYSIKRKPDSSSKIHQPKQYDPFDKVYYSEQIYDSIRKGGNYSHLEKGILGFYTQRDVTLWLKSMHKLLGRPDSSGTNYTWRKKNFYNHKKATIFCEIESRDTPSHWAIKLIMLDRNLQLIDDSLTNQLVKHNIQSLVFNQKKVKKDSEIDSLISLGHKVYFSNYDWEYQIPINFDAVMRSIAKNQQIKAKWEGAIITCLVNEKGKIDDWKIDNENQKGYENNLLDTLKNYQSKFQFPIKYLLNKPNKAFRYRTKIILSNVIGDNINQKNKIASIIKAMNKGKYKKNEQKPSVKRDETANTGNTVFFNLDMRGFDTLFFDVPFCNKNYSVYLDYENLYFFQKVGNKWVLKQRVEVEDKFNLGIEDINQDSCRDVIVSSGSNSNGNMWSDIFTYNADKDTFLLSAEDFCCVYSSLSQEEANTKYKPNSKYYITYYGGSWYMPSFISIYSWQEGELQLEAEVGTELLFQTMSENDYPIFFINKNINGKMTNIQSINLAGGKNYIKKAEEARQALLDEYFQ